MGPQLLRLGYCRWKTAPATDPPWRPADIKKQEVVVPKQVDSFGVDARGRCEGPQGQSPEPTCQAREQGYAWTASEAAVGAFTV
jgi:hypothetical protein